MQTKTQTKILIATLFGIVLMAGLLVAPVFAASVSSTLSVFTLDEDPSSADYSTTFTYTLSPNPTGQITTSFSTNGECEIGHNNKEFSTGGSVITQNDNLWFGLRAFDDTDDEGSHTCEVVFSSESTYDPEYATAATLEYSIAINDNDTLVIDEYSLSRISTSELKEGEAFVDQYQIGISHAPIYDVVITAIADSQCDILAGSAPNQSRVKLLEQRFKASSSTPIKFTIVPVDDTDFEGIHQCSIQHTASTADFDFKGVILPSYTTSILDNDQNPNIPDQREYEGGLIYYRDANLDGTDDIDQPGVTSFININNNLRQGLVIVDQQGQLAEGCSFVGEPASKIFNDSGASTLTSPHGEVQFRYHCANPEEDIEVVWLLDAYIEQAKNWIMYDSTESGKLQILNFNSIIYNLGDDFTTGIVLDFEQDGTVSFLQTLPTLGADPEIDASLAASVNNSRLNPLAIASIVSAVLAILWLVYRKYFSTIPAAETHYPRVDRF